MDYIQEIMISNTINKLHKDEWCEIKNMNPDTQLLNSTGKMNINIIKSIKSIAQTYHTGWFEKPVFF
jgi:hypothetical protein